MVDKINGISNCELVDHGDSLQFSVDAETGAFTLYKIPVVAIPRTVQIFMQFHAAAERSAMLGGRQAQTLVDPWHVTDIRSGHHMLDPQTIGLRLETAEGIPVVATMSVEVAEKTIRSLQARIDGAKSPPPASKPN